MFNLLSSFKIELRLWVSSWCNTKPSLFYLIFSSSSSSSFFFFFLEGWDGRGEEGEIKNEKEKYIFTLIFNRSGLCVGKAIFFKPRVNNVNLSQTTSEFTVITTLLIHHNCKKKKKKILHQHHN